MSRVKRLRLAFELHSAVLAGVFLAAVPLGDPPDVSLPSPGAGWLPEFEDLIEIVRNGSDPTAPLKDPAVAFV